MKSFFYLILILAAFSVKAQQTYSITGTVNDEKGASVPGATVFITNSRYATATNNEGKFSFYNIHPGVYEVVIKMLGFDPLIQSITVHEKSVKIIARLTESTTALNAVNITAKKKGISIFARANYLELFLENFIGQTINAQRCRLLNPGVLNYKYDSDQKILKVSADDFLVIENMALGYKIKYLLTDFELHLNNNGHTCTYGGYPYFEELKGTPDQQKVWDENRRVTYLSSDRHFFRALMNNTLEEEGFRVYMITSVAVNNTDKKYKRAYTVTNKFEKEGSDDYLYTYLGINNSSRVYKGYAVNESDDQRKLQTVKHTSDITSIQMAVPISNAASLFITNRINFKTLIAMPKIIGRDTLRNKDTIRLKKLYIIYIGEKEPALFYKTGTPINPISFIKLTSRQKQNMQITQVIPLADTITIDKNGSLTPAKSFSYSNYWAWLRIADRTPLDYVAEPVTDKKQ